MLIPPYFWFHVVYDIQLIYINMYFAVVYIHLCVTYKSDWSLMYLVFYIEHYTLHNVDLQCPKINDVDCHSSK